MFAEDNQKRIGVELQFVQPVGSMDYFCGLYGNGLAIFAEHNVGTGNFINYGLSQVSYRAFSLAGTPSYSHTHSFLQSTGVTANFIHRMHPEADSGIFLLVGGGFRNIWGTAKFDPGTEPEGLGGNPVLGDKSFNYGTGLKLAYQMGVGYDINKHWSASLRCQMSPSMGHTLPTLELAVAKRF